MTEIKIVTFDGRIINEKEKELADLIGSGWRIVAAGGGPLMVPFSEETIDVSAEETTVRKKYQAFTTGFIILQKDN